MLHSQEKCDKILAVKDGYLICPICRRNKRLLRIDPSTTATGLPVYCRDCKQEIKIDIRDGQSFESRS